MTCSGKVLLGVYLQRMFTMVTGAFAIFLPPMGQDVGEDYEVKVLHNNSYSTDQSLNGGWDEPQTFLVKEPPAEMWKIRIDPKRFGLPFFGDVRIPFGILPPSITVSTPGVALPSVNWSIDLTDDNAFLRGIGPDPVAPNEKALYVIAFGDIIGPPV